MIGEKCELPASLKKKNAKTKTQKEKQQSRGA
jgi:hypothetical protein